MKTALFIACAIATPAFAQFANFDADTEGFHGTSFASGGISFFDANNVSGFYPDGQPFDADDNGSELIIENSTFAHNDFPDFISAPNTLTFGVAFIPGDNLTIGPLATVSFSSASLGSSASFDMLYYELGPWEEFEVRFEALLNGAVVAMDSFTVAGDDPNGRDRAAGRHMELAASAFDTLRVSSHLNGEYTTIRALFDNVSITPVPGPATIALPLTGLAISLRRRR